jgi:hypothetical protein
VCTGTFKISSRFFTNLDEGALTYFCVEVTRDRNTSMLAGGGKGEGVGRDLPLQSERPSETRVWALKMESHKPIKACDKF